MSKIHRDGAEIEFTIDTKKQDVNSVLRELLDKYGVEDVDVANPSLEEVIESVYGARK